MDIIIGYDISDDRKRNKIFKELKYLGYQNIQYSVFLGINIGNLEINLTRELFEDLEIEKFFISPIILEKLENRGINTNIEDVVVF